MSDTLYENQVFRTVGGKPIRWADDAGVMHAGEGADVHPGIRLLWTVCSRDIPAGEAFTSNRLTPVTCQKCLAVMAARKETPAS